VLDIALAYADINRHFDVADFRRLAAFRELKFSN
jgi:hypothetical protein